MLRLSPCAQPCVFGKQSPGPLRCGRLSPAPLLLGYGAIFAEFLTVVRPLASVCSTSPPVSVFGTGAPAPPARLFSAPGGHGFGRCLPRSRGPGRPEPGPCPAGASPRAAECAPARLGSVDPTPVGYGLRPRLRPRLTLGGRAFPRKPRASGGVDSHHASLLVPASSLPRAPRSLAGCAFPARGTLPYRWGPQAPSRRFGASLSP